MMDLYTLHSNPEKLHKHHEADYVVIERILKIAKSGKQLNQKQLDKLATSAEGSFDYAINVLKRPFFDGHKAIASDPYFAPRYAHLVIKGPWPLGEKIILTDAGAAYYYARDVIKGRFPAGEKILIANPKMAYLYSKYAIKSRFKLFEKNAKKLNLKPEDHAWIHTYETYWNVKL